MSKETSLLPWRDGIYTLKNLSNKVFIVSGENVKVQKIENGKEGSSQDGYWKFGDFGKTHPDVEIATGKKTNEVEVVFWGGKWRSKGVVNKDGSRVTIWNSLTNQLDYFEWISKQEYRLFKDMGEPSDNPSNHYKIQPGNIGKLIWITGAPGTGKSTAAHLLSKIFGYV